jgi:Domain of unknown function (DUF4189)
MNKKYRLAAVLLAILSLNATIIGKSYAWGCKAESNGDDAYGYSHSYDSRSDAENRALNECNSRTSSGYCYIVDCDSND